MKFTERDADMIRWINGHGFATIRQIAGWMGASYQAAQRRTQILAEADFLEHQWPFRGERVYLPTKRAVARSGDELPPLSRITHGSYVHDLKLIDLALWLAADTGGAFTPERRIRHERGLTGVGISGHVAMVFSNLVVTNRLPSNLSSRRRPNDDWRRSSADISAICPSGKSGTTPVPVPFVAASKGLLAIMPS